MIPRCLNDKQWPTILKIKLIKTDKYSICERFGLHYMNIRQRIEIIILCIDWAVYGPEATHNHPRGTYVFILVRSI